MNLQGLSLEEMYAHINANAYIPLSDTPTEGKVRVMAQKVKLGKGKEFVFPTKGTGGATGESKYPWDEWFSGDLLLLERSEGTENDKGTIEAPTTKKDFEVTVNAMVPKIATAARRRYKVVQVSRKDYEGNRLKDAIIIQARDMDAAEKQAEDLKRAEEKEAKKKAPSDNGQVAPAPATEQQLTV